MVVYYRQQLRRIVLKVIRSNAAPESRYVVEKPADKPALKAERGLLAAATEGEEEGRP